MMVFCRDEPPAEQLHKHWVGVWNPT